MSTVSLTLPSDGNTIDASDVNNPLNAIAAVVNGGIDSTNVTPGGLTPASLQSGTGSTWAWQSWTPTLSGRFDDTKWTKTCAYVQIGKTVHFRMKLVANAGTPMSGGATDALFTLPVAHASGYAGSDQTAWIGGGGVYDNGTATFQADVYLSSASNSIGRIRVHTGDPQQNTAITSTVPMTWASTDEITCSGAYEAA